MGTLHSETLLEVALEAYLVSREKLHSCSTRGKHQSRGSLHSGKARIPREVVEEADVEEAPEVEEQLAVGTLHYCFDS